LEINLIINDHTIKEEGIQVKVSKSK